MPTKEELTNENAELRAKITELEEGQGSLPGMGVKERVGAMRDAGAWGDAEGVAFERSGLDVDEWEALSDDEKADAVLHVLLQPEPVAVRVRDEDGEFAEPEEGAAYRYDGSGDFVKVAGGDAERIEMLVKDVTRLEIERNDARNEVVRLKQRVADAGSLHGRIDSLPGVVG
jgi:hypothetical protein